MGNNHLHWFDESKRKILVLGFEEEYIKKMGQFISHKDIEIDDSIGFKNGYWIGGIVGMLGSNLRTALCFNYGEVEGIGSADGGVGGIVGSNYNSEVANCQNEGKVIGEYRVGGIVGFAQATGGIIINSINRGAIESKITRGSVSIGGIIGFNQAQVIYCENYGKISVPDEDRYEMYGGIVGYDKAGDTLVYGNVDHREESL